MTTVTDCPKRGYRTIRVPLAEADYERFLSDGVFGKAQPDQLYERYPALFPEGWEQGYVLCGKASASGQQQRRCQRARLKANGVVYTVAPSFVMPYMTGRVAEVEKAVFLRRFHVPCWALAHVLGRDAMYWYRVEQGLGRFNVVGPTVKEPERWPKDRGADEKPSRLDGEKIYIATTAGEGGILGASVTDSASEATRHPAYGRFAEEARTLDPD